MHNTNTAKSQPLYPPDTDKQTVTEVEINNSVSRGKLRTLQIRPGMSASSVSLKYLRSTTLEVEEQPSLFCGLMTSPSPAGLTIHGVGQLNIQTLSPFLIAFGDHFVCEGNHQAGSTCVGSSFRVFPAQLCQLAEQYNTSSFDTLIKSLQSGISIQQVPCTGRFLSSMNNLTENPYSGDLSRVFIEGCMLMLLAETARVVAQQSERPNHHGLTRKAVDRCHEVRQIIERDIASPPSLSQLSQVTGINATTLSNEFRSVFGVTIFAYLRDCRLNMARQLLQMQNLSVSQVGYRVGYNNPSAFSAAYRRHFGYAPNRELSTT